MLKELRAGTNGRESESDWMGNCVTQRCLIQADCGKEEVCVTGIG